MDFIRRKRGGKILEIVIDRPKANAINAELSTELGRTFAEFRDDDNLLVAIITGAGEKFFSAGWDLKSEAESDGLPDQSSESRKIGNLVKFASAVAHGKSVVIVWDACIP